MKYKSDIKQAIQQKLLNINIKLNSVPYFKKIIANSGWLIFEKFLYYLIVFFVNIWMVRYLGPENFGILSYALAMTLIFMSLECLGLDNILVREFVEKKNNEFDILGTAFFLRLSGGIIAFILIVFINLAITPITTSLFYVIAILSARTLFKSSEVISLWFESKIESKYCVYIRNLVAIFISLLKLLLIIYEADLAFFAWVILIETVVVSLGYLLLYKQKGGNILKWRFSKDLGLRLLKQSWPLMLTNMAIIIYLGVDQVMLGLICSNTDVGIYAAAVRISEIWYIFPVAVTASYYPMLVSLNKQNSERLLPTIQKLYDFFTVFFILISLCITFFSSFIIYLLYGEEYSEASNILAIHIWAGVFVAFGSISGKHYLLEGKETLLLYRSMMGMATNIVLNYLFIPLYGPSGAAIATVISYGISDFGFDLFCESGRNVLKMKMSSFLRNSLLNRKALQDI